MNTFTKIYSLVSKIPQGKVMTYGQIAGILNIKNPRVVGFAMAGNKDPKTVPCHRVVKSDGTIGTGYAFGGVTIKKELLQKEGVEFITNNTINLATCLHTV
jgi:methylated-DNA-protein-cysteine methyltransferase-like protein